MKKLSPLFILFAVFFSSCAKDDAPEARLSVTEFYNYCASGKDTCGEPLMHEGEYVTITGYAHALNSFENENRFQLFNSASMTTNRVEIKVIDDQNSIFTKLRDNTDATNMEHFTKFNVTGKIIGLDLPTNGQCTRAPFLEVNSSDDIGIFDK